MMAGLFRLIWYAFLAYIIYAVIRFFSRSSGRKSSPRQTPRTSRAAGMMVKDEVCHIYLPREDALREIQGGQEYFFCSQECRKKFLESRKESPRPASPAS
ncbi:MAG: hypothetical protein WCB96_01905 [Candidatus Aminicenantales bacterium]|jgi:uncharacterized protein